MKKINRKGFTIVELVIVIAVIAILAAVLIPTFTKVGNKAKESAAMQSAKNEFTEYLAEHAKELTGSEEYIIKSENNATTYYFYAKGASFNSTPISGVGLPNSYDNKTFTLINSTNIYKYTPSNN